MSFAIDPSYFQTDPQQMLTGYDFTELQLANNKIDKEAKVDATKVKEKAASDLGVKPVTGADKQSNNENDVSDESDDDNTGSIDDGDGNADKSSLQDIWNDVDAMEGEV